MAGLDDWMIAENDKKNFKVVVMQALRQANNVGRDHVSAFLTIAFHTLLAGVLIEQIRPDDVTRMSVLSHERITHVMLFALLLWETASTSTDKLSRHASAMELDSCLSILSISLPCTFYYCYGFAFVFLFRSLTFL